MTIREIITKKLLVLCVAALAGSTAAGQNITAPREETLLNGLRLVMWPEPGAGNVTVRLRVHAGSAFDPQGREGTMRALAESIFPNKPGRDYFTDDLGGGLEIVSNYDYIELKASSRPAEFLTLLETLASGVSNPVIDKETTDMVKAPLLEEVARRAADPAYIADMAAAERLFGTFPYGRPDIGSTESLTAMDFADIRFGYDRFFGADNATLTISGDFDAKLAYRAVRRYFGAWLKSDRTVPATFRQPDPAPAAMKTVESPAAGRTEIRYALRGVSRGSNDYAASEVLARIYESRLKAKTAAGDGVTAFVHNNARLLPGSIVFGLSGVLAEMKAKETIADVLDRQISEAEFIAAKGSFHADRTKIDAATLWLDADTYRLASVKQDIDAARSVTLAEVRNLADRLKAEPIAAVIVLPPPAEEQPQQ
jgi:predicted Zn-dependent peptidase